MNWQDLEKRVREAAELKFGHQARAEDIAGIKCDCVVDLQDGSVALIEISKQSDLTKLREDLAKFNILRPHYLAKNIHPKCYFITQEDPTPSLIASGEPNFVTVQSVSQFIDQILGFNKYIELRKNAPFGSAVDLYSGEPDKSQYVQVKYSTSDNEQYSTSEIASELLRGKVVVLTGNYGSGKSRCVKEVFDSLCAAATQAFCNPIAINLKENWGLKRASEMLTRHFTELGLQDIVDNALKVAYASSTIYLLDGFDEIGAQTWSDEPSKLVAIRQQSLLCVKDLVTKSKGGILITGREHYFNNDAEMAQCLGLDRRTLLFLQCEDQLTDEQFAQMLGHEPILLPAWMPKKPLIATVAREMTVEIFASMLSSSSGEVDFWNLLIDAFCEREAKINSILDPSVIRKLYTEIGRIARNTDSPLGPVSIRQINQAFENSTGRPPTDESAIVLQRLPGLSRIGAESLDRQFIDTFILDGLKAEDVLDSYSRRSGPVLSMKWKHPVEDFGARFVATRLLSTKQIKPVISFLKSNGNSSNRVLLSDLVAALMLVDDGEIDFSGFVFTGGRFHSVNLSESLITGLNFSDCHFEVLDITESSHKDIRIDSSTIARLSGVSNASSLPGWIHECLVDEYESVETLSAIKQTGLSVAQTFLMSSLRKLFLQPGSGRKSSSMYKGYGDLRSKRTCEKVIAILIREKFCEVIKGDTEDVYIPNRSLSGRVKALMSQMSTSQDPIWSMVSRLE
jgi:hypothetical protein